MLVMRADKIQKSKYYYYLRGKGKPKEKCLLFTENYIKIGRIHVVINGQCFTIAYYSWHVLKKARKTLKFK
jgi:hypothetical protein